MLVKKYKLNDWLQYLIFSSIMKLTKERLSNMPFTRNLNKRLCSFFTKQPAFGALTASNYSHKNKCNAFFIKKNSNCTMSTICTHYCMIKF